MFKVLVAGLPVSAYKILEQAMSMAFGNCEVSIEEVPREKLRSRVRISSRSIADILVVLDEVSTGLCKDIENGLYQSKKFHTYTTDERLVEFLNATYDNVNLEVPKSEEVLNPVSVSDDVLDEYKTALEYKERVIENLKAQIVEYEERIKDFVFPTEEGNTVLSEENVSLRNKILDSESALEQKNEDILKLEKQIELLSEKSKSIENKRKSLLSSYDAISTELTDLKVLYSKQSGVLKEKDHKIEELSKKLDLHSAEVTEINSIRKDLNSEKSISKKLQSENAKLESVIRDKESDILRYLQELEKLRQGGTNDEVVEGLKRDIAKLRKDKEELQGRVENLLSENKELQDQSKTGLNGLEDLTHRIEELKDRIEEDGKTIAVLNKEKLELKSKVDILEVSTDKDSSMQAIMEEMVDYREKYNAVTKGVFGKISSLALPKSSVSVQLTRGGVVFSNVQFAFAGSAESRKGAYKCILRKLKDSGVKDKYLIVDLVSETSIDYVFEIQKVVTGINWLNNGGSVRPYVSETCLDNVWVLSSGLSYVNDAYFLTVNWEKRLSDLEKSGYKVIVFCGDISNLIGRVLHESFANLGKSVIYVNGNAVGSRTIITNLRGLSNSTESEIVYYDFNSMLLKFFNIVSKDHRCSIFES